jgi:hypothetical protein
MDFRTFKNAVARQFSTMQDRPLYKTAVSKDDLWLTYISSFPEGTDPMFRERTQHDCAACKSFIRAVGNVVSITEKGLVSLWDIVIDEPAYQTVADELAALVKNAPIENLLITPERTAGMDKSFEELLDGQVQEWQHFFVNIPAHCVAGSADVSEKLAGYLTSFNVMKRGLDELTVDAAKTVLELIAQNSLYRGEEHSNAVRVFKIFKEKYDALEVSPSYPDAKDHFIWTQVAETYPSIARIRNTAIGSLLIDLSAEVSLEEAVRKFESVVAPANYKRPTAIVTPQMVEDARKKVDELGLTSALERRYATASDISINDILFADRSTKPTLAGNVFDIVAASVSNKKPKSMDKIEEVPIEKFLKDILPQAASIELMVENTHIRNLVSLIAPADPTAGKLFKWNNNFSWAYKGDMADSIKEKVKAAGGNVTGDLCCRLAWYNYDDLDLHMKEPTGGHIYYSYKGPTTLGGELDVDMNASGGNTREPVENIFYGSKAKMKEGIYHLFVNQYRQRESRDAGFEAEIDFLGENHRFEYDKVVKGNVTIAKFEYSQSGGIKILESLPPAKAVREVWGITTNKYHKVNIVMYSPNHWESTGSAIGNKHYMFLLEGCQNPDNARGFFNEYLKEELNEHRKVFEVVGSKMLAPHTTDQLSGLGFSNTQRGHVLCRVKGSFSRVIKIVF